MSMRLPSVGAPMLSPDADNGGPGNQPRLTGSERDRAILISSVTIISQGTSGTSNPAVVVVVGGTVVVVVGAGFGLGAVVGVGGTVVVVVGAGFGLGAVVGAGAGAVVVVVGAGAAVVGGVWFL